MAALDASRRADQLKDDANRSLHEDRPQEALSLYTKAIGIQPSAVLYANRAAAQMRIGRLQKAIDDANEALKLDRTYAKAYYRKRELYVMTSSTMLRIDASTTRFRTCHRMMITDERRNEKRSKNCEISSSRSGTRREARRRRNISSFWAS